MTKIFEAIIIAAALGVGAVQAAEPTGTLTLACRGTVTIEIIQNVPFSTREFEPDTISMSLIINFTNHTIQGISRWMPYLFDDQLQITDLNEIPSSSKASANLLTRLSLAPWTA